MNIQFELDADQANGRFYQEIEGERKAFMEILMAESGRMVIKHTEVHSDLEGQGYGKALINAAVDFARRKDYTIVPVCPFANNVMSNHREVFGDVLA